MKKQVILFIQSEVAKLKRDYKDGKIDLNTLQLACKSLNNVSMFASTLKENQ